MQQKGLDSAHGILWFILHITIVANVVKLFMALIYLLFIYFPNQLGCVWQAFPASCLQTWPETTQVESLKGAPL